MLLLFALEMAKECDLVREDSFLEQFHRSSAVHVHEYGFEASRTLGFDCMTSLRCESESQSF